MLMRYISLKAFFILYKSLKMKEILSYIVFSRVFKLYI